MAAKTDKRAKYRKIGDDLKDKIARKVFPGGKLPSMRELCRTYSVSLMTARQAVNLLEREGLVESHPDVRGTLVKADAFSAAEDHESFGPDLHASGRRAAREVTLNYYNAEYATEAYRPGWDKIVAAFYEKYPWIKVNFQRLLSLDEAIWLGEKLDVIQLGARDIASYRRAGVIADMSEYAKRDPTFSEAVFLSVFDDIRRRLPGVYAVPQSLNIGMVFYDTAFFGKLFAGRETELSAMGLSWDDFLSTARQVVAAGGEFSVNVALWSYFNHFVGELAERAVKGESLESLETALEILKLSFDSIKDKSALRECYQNPRAVGTFLTGDGGTICQYTHVIPSLLARSPENAWNVLPMPRALDGSRPVEVIANCVGAGSRKKEEAWFFLKHVASPESQAELLKAHRIPVLKECFTARAFKSSRIANFPVIAELAPEFRQGRIPNRHLYIFYDNIVYPLLRDFLAGKRPSGTVIEAIKTRGKEIFSIYESDR